MFEQILEMVKEQLGGHPEVAGTIPAGQEDAVHHEVATQITNGLASQASEQGGVGDLLAKLQAGLTSGSPITSLIEGGLVGTLGKKFGLSPVITGAIAGVLPGLLQKFAHKANDPDDPSVTHESITNALSDINPDILSKKGMAGLEGLFSHN